MNLEEQEIYVVHGKMFWNYTFLETDTALLDAMSSLYQNCVRNNICFMEVLLVGRKHMTFSEYYWSSSGSLLLQLPPALARWILMHTEDMNWNTRTCQLYFSGQGEFLQWTATCLTLSTNIFLQHTNKLFSYYTKEVNNDIVYIATLFWGCYHANEGLRISARAV